MGKRLDTRISIRCTFARIFNQIVQLIHFCWWFEFFSIAANCFKVKNEVWQEVHCWFDVWLKIQIQNPMNFEEQINGLDCTEIQWYLMEKGEISQMFFQFLRNSKYGRASKLRTSIRWWSTLMKYRDTSFSFSPTAMMCGYLLSFFANALIATSLWKKRFLAWFALV